MRELSRRGSVRPFEKLEEIESEQEKLEEIGYESNDPHILAFARACGARMLYTADKKLIKDFENPDIINEPEGRIYSNAETKNILLEEGLCNPPT